SKAGSSIFTTGVLQTIRSSGAGEVLTSRCSRGESSRPLELCASELRPSARTRPIVGKLFLERRGDRKSYQISSSKSLLAVLKVIRAGLPLRGYCSLFAGR